MKIQEGDRVRVKEEKVREFIQPWAGRFAKGCAGTVVAILPDGRVKVEFESKRKKKRASDWIINLYQTALEAAE